jgi:hypothetical protein
LEEWVRLTLENNPSLREKAAPPVTLTVASDRTSAPAAETRPPETSSEPADPFDPNIFNRQMHSKK